MPTKVKSSMVLCGSRAGLAVPKASDSVSRTTDAIERPRS